MSSRSPSFSSGLDGRVIQSKLAIMNVPSEIFDVRFTSISSPCRPFLAWVFHCAVFGAQAVVGIRICHFLASSFSQRLLARDIRSTHTLVECPALPASGSRHGCVADTKIGAACQSERLVAIDKSGSHTCSIDRDSRDRIASPQHNLAAGWL
jgi:hypothetical protein